jgi:hypothetical protein
MRAASPLIFVYRGSGEVFDESGSDVGRVCGVTPVNL